MAATAVTRAQNRAIAKGTDPKAATCRAKLQRARSALNRQMDRELRLREGAENLLRATTKDGGNSDNSGIVGSGGGRRNKSKSRKLIRQTVALELSFLDSNVRLLADELAELNGSVDVYQYRDDDDDDNEDDFDSRRCDPASADGSMAHRRRLRRQRLMPMIAVPLKDTRPIDFGPPLERFISQHYGVDLSATPEETSAIRGGIGDDGDDCDGSGGVVRRRSLSLREAIDELTQLRVDTQTPSRDLDGVRLLLRYYRQLYYVDRRFFPPAPVVAPVTTTPRNYHQHNRQQQDPNYRHIKQQQHSTAVGSSFSSPPPAIYFEWYDSFGGPVPSCGQRTVRFEQACVLFNVAAVHTQMGAKYDRRCRDDADEGDDDDYSMSIGSGKRAGSSSTSTVAEPADGSAAAAQCFLRAAGAYRHIGDTFANAPARAADLRATGVLYALMMAQAHECAFEKLQWRFLTSVRQRCRRRRHREYGTKESEASAEELGSGDHRGRGDTDAAVGGVNMGGMCEVTVNTPTWTELAREAAHVSRMYGDVVYNSCCRPPNDKATHRGKENGGEQGGTPTPGSMLPDVWVAVCRIKDRHYAALAYRFAACALLPYRRCSADEQPRDEQHHVGGARRRSTVDSDASQLLTELTAAAAAVGLEIADDDDDDDDDEATSVVMRQRRRRKQLGMLLLEAAAAAHDRADRAQRLCRQLRAKSEGNTSGSSGGGGLLAGVLDQERQRTVRLLLLQRRDEIGDNEYGTAEGEGKNDRRVSRAEKSCSQCWDCRDCCSDDDDVDAAAVADYCSGDQEEFTGAGIAGVPGLDVDRGVLIRPRTRFRLMSIAPDFTDTGDGDNYADVDEVDGDGEYDSAAAKQRGGGEDRHRQKREERQHEIADREERRADLFAGLGPVAVFSARHQCSRPRWVKVAHGGGRHRSPGGGDEDVCDDDKPADPIQLVDRWFGFELRSHGGGTAAAVPPATVGHVRSSSQAQHVGLRRGDIVVALKLSSGDGGGRAMDVRWETCRRVAELIVHQYQRRRRSSSGDGSIVIQLKVVTPITAATASDGYPPVDPNKIYKRRSTNMGALTSTIHSAPLLPPILSQSNSKQRRQRRQNANGGSEGTESTNKKNTWLWNPFRRRRRSAVGNKC